MASKRGKQYVRQKPECALTSVILRSVRTTLASELYSESKALLQSPVFDLRLARQDMRRQSPDGLHSLSLASRPPESIRGAWRVIAR